MKASLECNLGRLCIRHRTDIIIAEIPIARYNQAVLGSAGNYLSQVSLSERSGSFQQNRSLGVEARHPQTNNRFEENDPADANRPNLASQYDPSPDWLTVIKKPISTYTPVDIISALRNFEIGRKGKKAIYLEARLLRVVLYQRKPQTHRLMSNA